MMHLDEKIIQMFDEEFLKLSLTDSLKGLIIEELKKYVDVLKLEIEASEFNAELLKEIDDGGTLLLTLLFALNFKHSTITLTLAETLILSNVLYCCTTYFNTFPSTDTLSMNEYQMLWKDIHDALKIVDREEIECYKREIRGRKIEITPIYS